MKSIVQILVAFTIHSNVFGQEKSLDPEKTLYFFYIVPTSIAGSTWGDIDALWCEIGYGHVAKKHGFFYDVKALVKSYPNNGGGYFWKSIGQVQSTGLSTSFEYKRVLNRKFYFGAQFYGQTTKTTREETYTIDGSNSESTSQYLVTRNEFGILPKFGFLCFDTKDLSCDIDLGCVLRYITSKADGKMNLEENNEKEFLANKVFDHGEKFAQRVSLQFRVGYAF